MDSIYIILIVLAVILFTMGVIISIFQKRMMQINLDNTLSMTSNLDLSNFDDIDDTTVENVKANDTNHPGIIKHCDADEMLDFIDEEIL